MYVHEQLFFQIQNFCQKIYQILTIKNLSDLDHNKSTSDCSDKDFKCEKIIIHGHTPEKKVINFPYRINIDTGCFFSGKLSSVCLNDNNNEREFIYS